MNLKIERALLSVYDKNNLLPLARFLAERGVELIASGGTAAYLQEQNIAHVPLEQITGFPEILDGRVKTLHPKIHGGLLALREKTTHQETLTQQGIPRIDLLVVNLYPFEEATADPNLSHAEALEYIDIGGPCLLRSAAKNYAAVVVLSDPQQYSVFMEEYAQGQLNEERRRLYARQAFQRTQRYDQTIADFLAAPEENTTEQRTLKLRAVQELRYGENPHQSAKLWVTAEKTGGWSGVSAFRQLHGPTLSYNNWLDLEAAWALISEFEPEYAACAIIKHNNPCGVALGADTTEAYQAALDCDPVSAFGGIVVFNQEVSEATALELKELFLEVIVAPSFSPAAQQILSSKAKLRLLTGELIPLDLQSSQWRSILGSGVLEQSWNRKMLEPSNLKVVTKAQPTQEDWLTLLFAFRVVKHLKSNAIALVQGNRTVGLCAGETSRVGAVKTALEKASDLSTGAVLASDGFFPFADNVELIAQGRVRAVIQPGGSIRDAEVITAADRHQIPMVFTGIRHFKH